MYIAVPGLPRLQVADQGHYPEIINRIPTGLGLRSTPYLTRPRYASRVHDYLGFQGHRAGHYLQYLGIRGMAWYGTYLPFF